ncbi:MAG: EAL domain-containing protein [Eubacterium sp.]|nr:EAL domain-containing protein [Eubacterium sp.]
MRILRNITCALAVLCACGAVLLFPVLSVSAASGDKLIVGIPADRCPTFYTDGETGKTVGIGVDLFRMAAENAGFEPEFRFIGEKNIKEALDNDVYDVLLPFGSAITSKSGKPTVVSDNLFQTPFTLVSLNKRGLPSLSELKAGMLHSQEGVADTVRRLFPGIRIEFYETVQDCVDALRKGDVQALLNNSFVWSYILQKPSYSDLMVLQSAIFTMDFRAGTQDTHSGREIIERLNGGIAKMTDQERQAVVWDYTTRRLYQYGFFDYLYEYWLFFVIGGIIIIAIVSVLIIRWRMIRSRQEKKIVQLRDRDTLTDAYNLNGFRDRAGEVLRNNPDLPYVLFYNNIKNFKYINDSYGMEVGDELLCFLADRIMDNLTDIDVICRIEADHFAVLRHLDANENLGFYEKAILRPVRDFLVNQDKETRVQLCAGAYALTMSDHQAANIDHLLDFARLAEKRLRDNHNEGIEFYNPDQWNTGRLRADVAGHLPVALETGEIQVWYQPQVDYESGEVIGAEALCRWKHAKRGWISPAEFIPALEDSGLIYDLDCYVWNTVCKDLRRWNKEGIHRSVSVNISRADLLKSQSIPEYFCELLSTYLLTPDQIRIEITETAFVENPELLILTTGKFREYGFHVEMDDFGSGYSSLNMLKEVQVDRIKMDLHFLTETGDTEKGRIIVKHVIQMARDLKIGLITEGVETGEQAAFLGDLGCTDMQGFYFHKPMPTEKFEKLNSAS